ncbi:uncharacterized protein LOC115582047 isoform X2 [Sparus aurata]|uniref:uncharacterized protein LOC115582047 isoform X2 n=1 Tax=Sparus aurata TaxID=8175 RepID=UPI0011C0EE4A|nr:uncharacterized protein LOC115582047 isoform X2 [Sparus aurata]
MPYLGVSCDGSVSCDCCGEGVIEAKCPYRWGQDTSTGYQQWLENKRGHLESLTNLKRSHAYFTQVQIQMFVTKRMYADFITWTPQTCLIFKVQRDEDFISGAINVMQTFWSQHILHKLWELKDAQSLHQAQRKWAIQNVVPALQGTNYSLCRPHITYLLLKCCLSTLPLREPSPYRGGEVCVSQ